MFEDDLAVLVARALHPRSAIPLSFHHRLEILISSCFPDQRKGKNAQERHQREVWWSE